MGRPRKEIPTRKVEVTCRYCERFSESAIIFRKGTFDDTNTKLRHNRRWCTPVGKLVDILEPVCKHFKENQSFYCRNNHYYLDIVVCGHRKGNSSPECRNCMQYAEILELRRLIHRKAAASAEPEITFVKRELPKKGEEPKRVIKRFTI